MLSKEILVIELPLRYPLEAEALVLMATVLQPFLSTHWCLQKSPIFTPSVIAGLSLLLTILEES